LPPDVETLVNELRTRFALAVLKPSSDSPHLALAESAIVRGGLQLKGESVRVDCYLAPDLSADIRLMYVPLLSIWSVETESEVIEFSGCEYDGKTLVRGRFYFQNDVLRDGAIVPKRADFLRWADRVFRAVKKSLHRSNELDAYVGEQAEKWRQEGGIFTSRVT